jgi:hypothetical protein
MKMLMRFSIVAAAVLLGGCSSTKFTEYHGSDVFQGAGGEERSVDGIVFWQNGYPDRKYKILGVIEESRKHRLPLGRFSRIFSDGGDSDGREAAIAKAAHEHGGDAVIFVERDRGQSDTGQFDEGNHRQYTLVVIKYLE